MSRYKHTRTADVGVGALQEVLHSLPLQRLEAGLALLRQGESSEFAYYLTDGEVAVFAESPYGRTQLAVLQAPRLVGELGVLAGFPHCYDRSHHAADDASTDSRPAVRDRQTGT
ncbi:MAG: cyclic nucleotide-binding domain-containing protein [Devosia sp.]|nr:cyclic nucleotide-binding domain-containing protein [Devosia sp.]